MKLSEEMEAWADCGNQIPLPVFKKFIEEVKQLESMPELYPIKEFQGGTKAIANGIINNK